MDEITAKDLRIGNFVNLKNWEDEISFFSNFDIDQKQLDSIIKDGKGFASVMTICNDELELSAYGCDLDFYCYDGIEPILITEEILRDLKNWDFIGFGTRIIYRHVKFNAIKIEMCVDEVAFYFNDDIIIFKKYLHELQNLFFMITRKELEFKNN